MEGGGFRAWLRYRSDEFLGGGAGRQLLFLFVLTMLLVAVFAVISWALHAGGLDIAGDAGAPPPGWLDRAWFYFARFMDAGTMGGDEGNPNRLVSSFATMIGVIVAGLLISSLAGNFQERLDAIKRGGSPVIERGHFLVLGWSEKIYSVIDQLTEAYVSEGRITVVVMAEQDKVEMETKLRDKVVHKKRVKLVVRSGNSVVLGDLAKVAVHAARAIIVLVDEADAQDPSRADGRVIKTIMAVFNHPTIRDKPTPPRLTAEVMLAENVEIASIASYGKASIIKTNEIISKILLQTARITGLSFVYDELLRFEGNEIHYAHFPQITGRRFGDILLDFPNGCPVGVAKTSGESHILNPPADHVIQADEELLVLAEDDNIRHQPYQGPLRPENVRVPAPQGGKPVAHMLILGWNQKVFPIVAEFDNYVGEKSTLTIVSTLPSDERKALIAKHCSPLKNTDLRHITGAFTSRALLEKIQPQHYPTVMVLGDAGDEGAEAADTRAIIALLLLRDFRRKAGIASQEVCSEILEPRNRDLAATTEIHDIVISNEMVSLILAQVTNEPRVWPVLDDLFQSAGSEIYLKDLRHYAPPGHTVTFEYLMLAAKARGEVALGVQVYENDPKRRYGLHLNPMGSLRQAPIVPKEGDRLVVLAEDDS